MTTNSAYLPVLELTRGSAFDQLKSQIVESIHFGAVAVVDVNGNLLASYGDPYAVTYLRSTAKPFQALPFLEAGGQQQYGLDLAEIALICSSHSGTDPHFNAVTALQAKVGVKETDLLCGTHQPYHEPTADALKMRGEKPSSNRHNCSGKHTGMIAFARMRDLPYDEYINPEHPIQQTIVHVFAEMCGLNDGQVVVGTDGCSAPNFAVPLYNCALAYARLCDPEAGLVAPEARARACHTITQAMTTHPNMIGGPGRFDTRLMEAAGGKIIAKGGAEGFQGIGIMPGTLRAGSPALGIALKISDGDYRSKATNAISLEVLRQLGGLTDDLQKDLEGFGPEFTLHNFMKLTVGKAYPCFELARYGG